MKAVDDVSFDLRKGRGARARGRVRERQDHARPHAPRARPRDGRQRSCSKARDITKLSERELRPLRRRMQIVFQDPHASLNPAMTIGMRSGTRCDPRSRPRAASRCAAAWPRRSRRVGLSPAEQFLDKYPSDLSGGQKQRAVIARAIILNPRCSSRTSPSRCST